jgi:hypothetical protein
MEQIITNMNLLNRSIEGVIAVTLDGVYANLLGRKGI